MVTPAMMPVMLFRKRWVPLYLVGPPPIPEPVGFYRKVRDGYEAKRGPKGIAVKRSTLDRAWTYILHGW